MPRVPPNLKAFGSRSRSASDASVATAGPCNHRPAAHPTPCRLAALCPWQPARIPKPGRVRWPEPPGLAAGSRTRGEAPEECGAWGGLPQSVAPSHAPVDRTLRFLPWDCAALGGWTIAPATPGLSEPVGTMAARSSRSSRPMVMVATDDRLGRPGARLLHGAGRGRRPQGLRCAHRQAPASALDPVVLAQQVAVMPCGARRVRRRPGVSFLLCAPGDISILRRHWILTVRLYFRRQTRQRSNPALRERRFPTIFWLMSPRWDGSTSS
jgi:hypothetical protein